jgi:hypothetical protein
MAEDEEGNEEKRKTFFFSFSWKRGLYRLPLHSQIEKGIAAEWRWGDESREGSSSGRREIESGEHWSRREIRLKQAIGIYGLLTGSVSRLTVAGWPREGREEIGQNVL